ncbi:MAG: Lpg1974 family pore-forming outer membrane protein [Gemmataceae bacterium]
MLRNFRKLLVLLVTALVLAPGALRAQDYAPPVTEFPFPLGPVDGEGLYLGVEFLYFRMTNPLANQPVAFRGVIDADGTISGPPGTTPGAFVGSGNLALDVSQVNGPQTWVPGYNLVAGWRFRNGVVVEGSWFHLEEAKYAASAGPVPPFFQQAGNLADSFLSAFVYNFPPDFAGAAPDVAPPASPGAAYGIWNGAEYMNIQFTQRFDQWDITGRFPIFQTENCRYYGFVGPRIGRIWERFKWRTADLDLFGNGAPFNTAIYSNIISNNLYGFHIGCGDEMRLGDTPVGTFSVSLDLQAAALLNVAKTRAKYEREDRQISAHHSRKEFTFVPELQAQINLWWYPIEGVQLRVGYNAMAFFNTISSPVPIDFDFGSLSPKFERETRFFDGLNAGIGIIF